MIESDYVFMKPLAAPPAEGNAPTLGHPFKYIQPQSFPDAMRKIGFTKAHGPVALIPNTGPAPILMRVADWLKVKYTQAVLLFVWFMLVA